MRDTSQSMSKLPPPYVTARSYGRSVFIIPWVHKKVPWTGNKFANNLLTDEKKWGKRWRRLTYKWGKAVSQEKHSLERDNMQQKIKR